MEFEIDNMVRDSQTGIVNVVHWRANLYEDLYYATTYGSTNLDAPDGDIIPYEELTKEIVVNWLKIKFGEEQLQAMEVSLQQQIEYQKNPPVKTGTPW